jgi:ribosomal protein L40E
VGSVDRWSCFPQPARPTGRTDLTVISATHRHLDRRATDTSHAWLAAHTGRPRPSVAAAPVCLRCLASFGSPGRPLRRPAPVGHLPPTEGARWPIRAVACTAGQHVRAPIIPHFRSRSVHSSSSSQPQQPRREPPHAAEERRTIRVHCVRCIALLPVAVGASRQAGPGGCSLPSPLVHSPPPFPFYVQVRVRLAGPLVRERAGIIAARSPRLLGGSVVGAWRLALLRYVGIGVGSAVLRSTLRTKRVPLRTVWTIFFEFHDTCQRRNDTWCIVRSPGPALEYRCMNRK